MIVKNIEELPTRLSSVFNSNRELGLLVEDRLNEGKKMPFMIITEDSIHMNIGGVDQLCFLLTGIFPDGRKVTIIVHGHELFIDIDLSVNKEFIMQEITDPTYKIVRKEIVLKRPFRGFAKNKTEWLRCYFHTTYAFRDFPSKFSICGSVRPKIASNDDKYFERLVRERSLKAAGWNIIQNYEKYETDKVSNVDGIYLVHSKDITKLRKRDVDMQEMFDKSLIRDNSMCVMFDTEVCRRHDSQNTDIMKTSDQDWIMSHLSMSFGWNNDVFANICIVVGPTIQHPEDDSIILQVPNQEQLIRAFIEVMHRMRPDIIGGFNSGNFDWPMMQEVMRRYGLIELFFKKVAVRMPHKIPHDEEGLPTILQKHSIKLTADENYEIKGALKCNGIIDIDVMALFTKRFPKSEIPRFASLSFFLKAMKLPAKVDAPIQFLFQFQSLRLEFTSGHDDASLDLVSFMREKYPDLGKEYLTGWETASRKERSEMIARINGFYAYYCVQDSALLHQLLAKGCVLYDAKELSNTSMTSLYNSYYKADGSRVRCFIAYYCHKRDVVMYIDHKRKSEEEKQNFIGATVLEPLLGMSKYPVTGLDFASLYPSIIQSRNLSPDKIVTDPEVAEQLIAEGYKLHRIEVDYKWHKKDCKCHPDHHIEIGWSVLSNGVVEEGDPIIDHWDKEFDGKSVSLTTSERTDDAPFLTARKRKSAAKYKAIKGRKGLPGEFPGILSLVVAKLKAKRAPIKKIVETYKKLLEIAVKEGKDHIVVNGEIIPIDEARFTHDINDSKQKAIKVLANTNYGEIGNPLSYLYMLLVAGGITSYGRNMIDHVRNFVLTSGYMILYGDTDSCYSSPPATLMQPAKDLYQEMINKGFSHGEAKLAMMHKMVDITMKDISFLKEEVNDYLMCINNDDILSVAYEESLYPCVMAGKKKYYGIAHIDTINFYPKSIFIRGLDVIKQGVPQLTKDLVMELLWLTLDPLDERTFLEKVLFTARKYFTTDWPIDNFVQSGKYKPNAGKPEIKTFIERMKVRYGLASSDEERNVFKLPYPGDRFKFVVVHRDITHNFRGNIVHPSKGDKIEFLDAFKWSQTTETPYKIDKMFYFEKSLGANLARLAAGYFDPEKKREEYKSYKDYDEARTNSALRYITEECRDMIGETNKAQVKMNGLIYKRLYKATEKAIETMFNSRYTCLVLKPYDIFELGFSYALLSDMINRRVSLDLPLKDAYINAVIEKVPHWSFSRRSIMTTAFAECEADTIKSLRQVVGDVYGVYEKFKSMHQLIHSVIREQNREFTDADFNEIFDEDSRSVLLHLFLYIDKLYAVRRIISVRCAVYQKLTENVNV